jgi:Flp pilus assembly protein TadG
MMNWKNRKKQKKEVGQSLVELALSFTFLMFLMSGTVDLARAFFTYIALQDASQEGAAYAAMDPTNNTEIISRVRQSSTNPIDLSDTTLTNVTVTVNGSACAGSGNSVTVNVSYQFRLIMPIFSGMFSSSTFPLWGSSTNTILTPGC